LSIPHPRHLRFSHLFLQLEDTIHQSLGGRWAPWDIDINRNDPIHTSHHTITVVIVSATVRAAPHADYPLRIRHLVVTQPHCAGNFVGHCASNNHHVGLSR
ncbi:hypothetical protein B0J11DRAFT_447494, partial [Dendryphion nanum]